jgi:hypothetical protein
MRLRASGNGKGKTVRERARRALESGPWIKVEDLVRRGSSRDEDGYSYAELAYFHPFVQEFLYGKAAAGQGGRHIFDLYELPSTAARLVEIKQPGSEAALTIQRALLHIFDGDIALLTLQLSATAPVKWETALNIVSHLRTVYFQDYRPAVNETGSGPGIVWKGGGGIENVRVLPLQASPPDIPLDRAGEMHGAIESGKPLIHAHWRALLGPLTRGGIETSALGDHRMAAMVFLGIEDMSSVSDDQWFALAQADDASFPRYAEAFQRKELAACVYDRWWDTSATDPNALKHRYLAGPLTYCSVLRAPRENRPAYIDGLRTRWRRQHYQTFLLAHYQRAALLAFQLRIAGATGPAPAGSKTYRSSDEIVGIQGDMALFSSGQWFTEVSPQVQGQELYSLLAKQLRLEDLYDGVIHDEALLGNWTSALEERRREKWRDTVSRFAIPIGLLASFFSGNVLVKPLRDWLKASFPWLDGFGRDAAMLGIALAAGAGLWCVIAYSPKVFRRR